jgi:hypothetical protein
MATIGESLAAQWDRGWQMLLDAFGRFPDDEWRRETPPEWAPVRLATHVIACVDFYRYPGEDAYKRDPRLKGDPLLAPTADLPSTAEMLAWAEELRAAVDARLRAIPDEGFLTEANPFPWTGANPLEHWLYGLRHVQHHLGEMHGQLRARGLELEDWH